MKADTDTVRVSLFSMLSALFLYLVESVSAAAAASVSVSPLAVVKLTTALRPVRVMLYVRVWPLWSKVPVPELVRVIALCVPVLGLPINKTSSASLKLETLS